jgi:hypothetical protein
MSAVRPPLLVGGVVAVALAVAIPAATLAAQNPQSDMLTAVFRQGSLRVGMVSGRMVLSGWRGGAHERSAIGPGGMERLKVGMNGGDPFISYQIETRDHELFIDFASANRLQIRRTPKAGSAVSAIDFRQEPGEPITLKVGGKDRQRVYRAASLWHLRFMEPGVCRDHLDPFLKMLQRDLDLDGSAAEVEQILLRTASSEGPPSPQRWAQWVGQLGDPQFSVREAADRRLREAGRAVTSYLERLDPKRLDAEQRYRIRRITQALSAGGDDTPDQIAAWLSGDPAIWLTLLARDAEPTRRLALRQLQALLGEPVAFDPAADPATRAKQLDALREKISPK